MDTHTKTRNTHVPVFGSQKLVHVGFVPASIGEPAHGTILFRWPLREPNLLFGDFPSFAVGLFDRETSIDGIVRLKKPNRELYPLVKGMRLVGESIASIVIATIIGLQKVHPTIVALKKVLDKIPQRFGGMNC